MQKNKIKYEKIAQRLNNLFSVIIVNVNHCNRIQEYRIQELYAVHHLPYAIWPAMQQVCNAMRFSMTHRKPGHWQLSPVALLLCSVLFHSTFVSFITNTESDHLSAATGNLIKFDSWQGNNLANFTFGATALFSNVVADISFDSAL